MNGVSEEFDHIIMCTGYKIDLPYLSDDVKKAVLNQDTNEIKVITVKHLNKAHFSEGAKIFCSKLVD